MNRGGDGGSAPVGYAPFLDRLVARAELSAGGTPLWPMLLCIPTTIILPLLVALVDEKWFAGIAILFSLVPILWLGLWSVRTVYQWPHPYASPRWLRAVHGVVGEDAMTELLVDLGQVHAGDPDHVLTRREVVDAVAVQRSRAREAVKRARGVRLSGPGTAA